MGRHDLGEPQRRFLRDPGGIALPSLIRRSRRPDRQRLRKVARRLWPCLPGFESRDARAGARRRLRGTRKRRALYLDPAWHSGYTHPGQPPRTAPERSPRCRAQTRGRGKGVPLPRDAPSPCLRPRTDDGTHSDTGPRQDLDSDASGLTRRGVGRRPDKEICHDFRYGRTKHRFRSRDWFDDPHRRDQSALYLERFMNYGITPDELRSGRPVVGIAQSGSDLSPCNRHHLELADRVRDGIRDGGGIPMEFPVHPINENCRRPTAALDRNLSYLGLVEILYGYF